MSQPLANAVMLRLLGCLALVAVPLLPRIPPWAAALVVALILWRGLAQFRHWPMPPAWLRALLALLALVGVYASYARVHGQQAGVSLLVVMMAFKLTELGSRRDCTVLLFLCYFVLITHFLYSQELGMILYLLGAALAITAVLIEISHPQGPLPPRLTLRSSAVILLQSLPVMLLLFVLFPRIPGPLWGLPSDAGAGRTGLSEEMTPGSISSLSQSDEVAFRVRFFDPPPPPAQRYWRGPILWYFDGYAWIPGLRPKDLKTPPLQAQAVSTRYEVTLEPHAQRWLLALDIPAQGPPGSNVDADYQLLAARRVQQRLQYQATSYTRYRLQAELPAEMRARALQLPPFGNPRARELVRQWRSEGLDDAGMVERALRLFREQEYVYTLQPPLLGRNSVDQFLFETRRGFCEHYASVFTFLMRAAGIPARIVTGYQGGELNPSGDYFILRQSDAHAWSEVWLENRGWVRIDPTSAVAPERIELGLAAALPAGEALPFGARRSGDLAHRLQLQWDWVNAEWNRWVLAYGPELQQAFLSRLGLVDWGQMVLALTLLVVGFLGLLGMLLLWQARPHAPSDAVLRQWLILCRKLARRQLPRLPHEGPQDYAARVAARRPDLAEQMLAISGLYIRLRYAGAAEPRSLEDLRGRIRRFRP